MYLDFSIKKTLAVFLLALILTAGVGITMSTKRSMFGSTPFFQAFQFWWKEQSSYVIYSLENLSAKKLMAGSGLFGIGGVLEYARGASTTPETKARAIPVLTYHRLVYEPDQSNTPIDKFKEQMYTLKEAGWQTVTLKDFQDFMEGREDLPLKSFLITFDDGAKNSFYPVDPLFKVLNYSGVNYIIVKSSKVNGSIYYLSPEEIKRMLSTGRWEIGSHSYDGHHPSPVDSQGTLGSFYADLLWVPEEGRQETPDEFTNRLKNDMERSRRELEETYGVTVDTLAFPYGETGMVTHGNFSQGIELSTREAEKVYAYGFLQTHEDDFSFNYPEYRSFLTKRIHVDHDWSGERLLSVLENGSPKTLPYHDVFDKNNGWLPSWGKIEAGWERLVLKALPDTTSASSILDGTALWKNYHFTAKLDWNLGSVHLLANASDARTYRACVFSDGKVRLQYMEGTERTTLGEKILKDITFGSDISMGIQVKDGTAACFFNGKKTLEVSGLRDRIGGIGVQTWDDALGNAQVEIKEVTVEAI